jgi:hypothetical protein
MTATRSILQITNIGHFLYVFKQRRMKAVQDHQRRQNSTAYTAPDCEICKYARSPRKVLVQGVQKRLPPPVILPTRSSKKFRSDAGWDEVSKAHAHERPQRRQSIFRIRKCGDDVQRICAVADRYAIPGDLPSACFPGPVG